jgi:hypothetical protein
MANRRNAMTIMDYFKEKPERATIYLVKRGCGHVSEFETEEGKTMEESIEDYLCSAGLCEFCPAKPCDDVCEDRLKKWLNLPVDELGGWTYGEYANSIDDLDPEDREAVQKILDAAAKNAREKKVMFYPSGMADLKKFNITNVVPPRADGAETAKKTSYEVKPPHYKIMPNVEVMDVISAILDRTGYTPSECFMLGNVIKYVLRADQKNGTEDYRKAVTYLKALIESREKVEKE